MIRSHFGSSHFGLLGQFCAPFTLDLLWMARCVEVAVGQAQFCGAQLGRQKCMSVRAVRRRRTRAARALAAGTTIPLTCSASGLISEDYGGKFLMTIALGANKALNLLN